MTLLLKCSSAVAVTFLMATAAHAEKKAAEKKVPAKKTAPTPAAKAKDPKKEKFSKMLSDPTLEQGLSKVVGKMRKEELCRDELKRCRSQCGTRTAESGCQMECETECSVCILERTGAVNNALCDD